MVFVGEVGEGEFAVGVAAGGGADGAHGEGRVGWCEAAVETFD
jgi:hypothetical protein